MFICNRCGDTFDEPLKKKDYHSEITEGRDYETYSVCPMCESENIEEAKKCEYCHDYIIDKDRDKRQFKEWCEPCENLVNGVMGTAIETLMDCGFSREQAHDMICAWAERNW